MRKTPEVVVDFLDRADAEDLFEELYPPCISVCPLTVWPRAPVVHDRLTEEVIVHRTGNEVHRIKWWRVAMEVLLGEADARRSVRVHVPLGRAWYPTIQLADDWKAAVLHRVDQDLNTEALNMHVGVDGECPSRQNVAIYDD